MGVVVAVACRSYFNATAGLGQSSFGIADFTLVTDYRFDMARQCTRQGCVHQATVTLTYQYGRSQVWLDNLSPERDPHAYDLCDQHANRLTPPAGWHLEDRRQRVHVYDASRLAG